MMDSATLEREVIAIIADVCALEESEVARDKRWFSDLEGESIGVLELMFQIEKKLKLKVDFNEILSGDDMRADARGLIPRESMARLKARYPFLAVERLPAEPTPELLRDLLTVDAIVGIVQATAAASASTGELRQPASPASGTLAKTA